MKNYQIIQEKYVKELDTNVTVLVHEKTKAKVLLLANDDENKTFMVGFRTPPANSTGLPHILEHSVLCGSRKFPVKEPFVDLLKASLNTFLNAFTAPDKTMYPACSCNDKDFQNLMDVYMDAVLYPNIYTRKEIFQQEGWHYELENPEDELKINGVVYNEMKGAFSSPDQVLYREVLHTMYPNNCYGFESGGNPDNIPDLTQEEFVDFHKANYHPSNSYIILYGNMNMEEKLEWLDKEYLSKFEYKKIDTEIKTQKEFEKPAYSQIVYPVGEGQDLSNKTYLAYSTTVGDYKDQTLFMAMNVLSYILLDAPGAILKEALTKAQIGNDISGSYDSGLKQPLFVVISKNANFEQKDEFVKVIEDTLRKLVKEGIDKKALKAAINNIEFKYREGDFGGLSKGLIYALNSLETWIYDENLVTARLETSNIFNTLKEKVETSYFEELITKYIIDNVNKGITVAVPSADEKKKKDQELHDKLANYKASLSKEEITKIIEDTKNLKIYQSTPATKEESDTIPLLSREDLKGEVVKDSAILTKVDNVSLINHDFYTNKIGYLKVLFDVSNVSNELLPYLGLFTNVLLNMDTTNYKYQELDKEININTGGVNFDLYFINNPKELKVFINASCKVLYDNVDYAFSYIKEIIKNTIINNKDRLQEIVFEQVSRKQGYLMGAGHSVSLVRALSYIDRGYYYIDQTSGISYYKFLEDLRDNFQDKNEELINKLTFLQEKIFRQDNITISYTALKEEMPKVEANVSKFINGLIPEYKFENEFSFTPNVLNEGFKCPGNVQYVARCGNYVEKGFKYNGTIRVLKNILYADYLWSNIRIKGGAYGGLCGFKENGTSFFVSYRDPNLKNTNKIYEAIPSFIENFEASEEDMTKCIIGAIGEFDAPLTASMKGARSLSNYLNNKTTEDLIKERQEIIDCTAKDIRGLKDLVSSILDCNCICVVGSEAKVEEDKDLFKEVKNLFK